MTTARSLCSRMNFSFNKGIRRALRHPVSQGQWVTKFSGTQGNFDWDKISTMKNWLGHNFAKDYAGISIRAEYSTETNFWLGQDRSFKIWSRQVKKMFGAIRSTKTSQGQFFHNYFNWDGYKESDFLLGQWLGVMGPLLWDRVC